MGPAMVPARFRSRTWSGGRRPGRCPRPRGRAAEEATASGTGTRPWSGGPQLERRQGAGAGGPRAKAVNRNSKRLLVYILDVPSTLNQNQVVIDLARRQRRPGGDWGPLKPWWHAPASPQAKYDPEDHDLLTLLEAAHAVRRRPATAAARRVIGGRDRRRWGRAGSSSASNQAALVERLARTGRLRLRRTEGEDDPPTMRWDDGPPWRFVLEIRPELGGKRWAWRGCAPPRRRPPTGWTWPSPWCSCPGS